MAHRHVLAYFFCTFGLVAGQSPKYVLKGLEVNIRPTISGLPDEILWKHNGNKVVEFNGREQIVYSPYNNRVTLDWFSAELNILHLTYEDSGDYELETYRNKELGRSVHKLEVIDKVAKPTISCEMIDGSSSNKSAIQATLMCFAESSHPSSMKLEWRSRGIVQPGQNLTISLGDELDNEVYSCNVSNPLSNDSATFTAKDCYPDKGSSVGLIVGPVIFIIALLFLVLGYMFRRKLVEACCEKGKRGSDEKTSQDAERQPFIDSATTLPSKQQLARNQPNDPDTDTVQGHVKRKIELFEKGRRISPEKLPADTQTGLEKNPDKDRKNVFPLSSPVSKQPSHPDLNIEPGHLASNNKEDDANGDEVREPTENELSPCDSSDSEKANGPDPAGVLDDCSEYMQSDVQSSTAPEQTESAKEADEDEEAKSAPASGVTPPSPQLRSPSTQSSPHMAPEDITVKLKEDAHSHQVTGETSEKAPSSDDSSEEKQASTIPEQKGSETTAHEQDSHSAQGETHTREDKQQVTDKPVSEEEKESDSVRDQEEIDKTQNQSIATSQQPQSATLTTPDNSNTNTFQVSPGTAHAGPEQGEGQSVEEKN